VRVLAPDLSRVAARCVIVTGLCVKCKHTGTRNWDRACAAVCCSVMRSDAKCCIVLQCVSLQAHDTGTVRVLQCVQMRCSVLQCVAQCVAEC